MSILHDGVVVGNTATMWNDDASIFNAFMDLKHYGSKSSSYLNGWRLQCRKDK